MKQTLNVFFYYEKNQSKRFVRIGILMAIFIYSIYAYLDLYMIPEHYMDAWKWRFGVIAPSALLTFILSFWKMFYKRIQLWLTLVAITAIIGMTVIITMASPNEEARHTYYIGYVLIIFWVAFIFRLSVGSTLITAILSFLAYNGAITLVIEDNTPKDFAILLNNNYFLLSASALALIGGYQLNRFAKKIREQNLMLEEEKKEIQLARDKAQESDRLKSAFLSNMSHEIRTPMNAILGFSELLKSELEEVQKNQFIDIIQQKGDDLMQLINDIIDISKIEANQLVIIKTTFNINELFDELKTTFDEIVSKSITKEHIDFTILKGCETGCEIVTDRTRLKQVLINLVNNAYKFTNAGSITVSYKLEGSIVLLAVKDTGIGIPNDKLQIVFDRFIKLDENISTLYGGTGLGLSIVRNLVELMGGKISVKSEYGVGTEFNFHIPLVLVD